MKGSGGTFGKPRRNFEIDFGHGKKGGRPIFRRDDEVIKRRDILAVRLGSVEVSRPNNDRCDIDFSFSSIFSTLEKRLRTSRFSGVDSRGRSTWWGEEGGMR